jgi:hypothetical protein
LKEAFDTGPPDEWETAEAFLPPDTTLALAHAAVKEIDDAAAARGLYAEIIEDVALTIGESGVAIVYTPPSM